MKRSRERMVEIAESETPKQHIGGCGGYYVDLYSSGCGGIGGCGGSTTTYYGGCGGSVSSGGC